MFKFCHLTCLLCVVAAHAVAPLCMGAEIVPKAAVCWKLSSPVEFSIDALSERLQNVSDMSDFQTVQKTKRQSAPNQARVKMAWDNQYLYMLVQCDIPDGETLRPSDKGLDADVFIGDSIEFYVYPKNSQTYYQFAYNVDGGGKFDKNGDVGKSWNAKWKVVCRVRGKIWESLLRIPFSSIGHAPLAGDYWSINVGRNDKIVNIFSAWSYTPKYYGSKSHMGYLFFGDPSSDSIISPQLPLSKSVLRAFGRTFFNPWELQDLCKRISLFLKSESKSSAVSSQDQKQSVGREARESAFKKELQTLSALNDDMGNLNSKFQQGAFSDITMVVKDAFAISEAIAQSKILITKCQLEEIFKRNEL